MPPGTPRQACTHSKLRPQYESSKVNVEASPQYLIATPNSQAGHALPRHLCGLFFCASVLYCEMLACFKHHLSHAEALLPSLMAALMSAVQPGIYRSFFAPQPLFGDFILPVRQGIWICIDLCFIWWPMHWVAASNRDSYSPDLQESHLGRPCMRVRHL